MPPPGRGEGWIWGGLLSEEMAMGNGCFQTQRLRAKEYGLSEGLKGRQAAQALGRGAT